MRHPGQPTPNVTTGMMPEATACAAPKACENTAPENTGPARPFPNAMVEHTVRRGMLSAPVTVTWEITNRCNLRCVHCLSDSSPEADVSGELGLEEAKAVLDQLAEAKVFQIHYGGGEPFSYPGFMELLRHGQARGFCCQCISTNGHGFSRQRIAELEALGGIYLQLSLDGAGPASCDPLRGAGTFARVTEALERMRGTTIVRTVNFVYCRDNAGELDAMLRLAEHYGATLRVTRLKPSGRGKESYAALRPTHEQLLHLHGWLQAHPQVLTGDTFFHLNPLGGRALGGFSFCGAGRMTCLITPNGDVFPCAFTQEDTFRAGNLRGEPFADIWRQSPVFNEVFRPREDTTCTGCPAHDACGGGCPAVTHALTGQVNAPDPDCVLAATPRPEAPPLCAE